MMCLSRPCSVLILRNYNLFKLRLQDILDQNVSLHWRYTIYFSASSIITLAVFTICFFGWRITSLFFARCQIRWNNYTHPANMSALLFPFYTQMDCALLQTFYGWLFFCICTTTLSRISWIIFSIMAACIQQLIAFWFVAINYRSSRYIWEFAAFLNGKKEGSA